MKKFFALLLVAVLIVSTIGVLTAFAGCGIDGKTKVYAGSTYKYTGKVSYTGVCLVSKLEGLGQTTQINKDSSDGQNGSLSTSGSISVKIPSDAPLGMTYKITLSGQYSVYNSESALVKKSFSTSKTIEVVKKPVSTPKPTTAPTAWELAEDDVEALAQGGTYNMEITDDTKIPASLLALIKEKQVELTINFGNYTCTIDSASLGNLPEDQGDIDLGMSLDSDETLSAALGGADIYQLHFSHNGGFPGKFTYRFHAMASQPGDILYLYYYYDQSGICEGKASAVVDEDGYAAFTIYHCSSYFVSGDIIEDASGLDFNSETAAIEAAAGAQEREEALAAELAAAEQREADLAAQLEEAQAALSEEEAAASADNPETGQALSALDLPLPALIAAMAGIALLSIFLTMMFGGIGIFRRKTGKHREDYPK